jgi:hypothetical protein
MLKRSESLNPFETFRGRILGVLEKEDRRGGWATIMLLASVTGRRRLELAGLGICLFGALLVGCGAPNEGNVSTFSHAIEPAVLPDAVSQAHSTCASPAASNPAGGGGTHAQIRIDPAVYGTADTSNLAFWGFDQDGYIATAGDPEVFELLPSIVPRGWTRWDTAGTKLSDYNPGYPHRAEADGVTFVGGTTATVLFQDEFPGAAAFNAVVSCDAEGRPVHHPPLNFFRGSMASPIYRNYIIGIGKIQIDAGADGVHFDEPDESFEGTFYGNGDEGFDDANVADFGGFLCGKYPKLTAAEWQSRFGVTAADNLNCSAPRAVRGRKFNYRGYLARNGWQTDPMTTANPLAAEWGAISGGHPAPDNDTFTGTYTSLVYWQDIVLTLRTYARQKYNREIYITANGIYPFVDFQTNGLTDGNGLGPRGTDIDFCPLTGAGDLDGTQSFLEAFLTLKGESLVTDGRVVPVGAFLDGTQGLMSRYLGLPTTERQDYWRMYVFDGLAAGVYFSMMINDGVGDPDATQLDLMPTFKHLGAFLKVPEHLPLFYEARDLDGTVMVSATKITTHLTQLRDGRTIAHLINHNYDRGFQAQENVVVEFPLAAAPKTVTLVSPDLTADTPVPFTYGGGQVHVRVPQLLTYTAVVAD